MQFKTALINMPFGFHIYPSIQLGTLSTLLKTHGWDVKSYYLNLHFAHRISIPVYNELCEKRFLTGEWLFSHLLFGDAPGNQAYTDHFAAHIEDVCRSIEFSPEQLLDLKARMIPEFLHWAVKAIDWGQYSVVGFTSTFNQNIASVTLAKLIKEKFPAIKILFGGANYDSEMGSEYFRAFEWIDYAVTGEAEHVLHPLMESIRDDGPVPNGVIHRKDDKIVYESNDDMFVEFENYGPPDYDDYFEQLREIDPNSPALENPIILYETARGCWWGEKHHCTFCGLNAASMKFRARGMEQVHQDIADLSKRYDTYRFRIVDNILELKYIDGVFGKLAEGNYDFQFFVEVKSNMTKQQIKTLAHGGVNVVQPGIESFSLNQLREMDKGVRPIQNILFLKWAMYYGIEVTWNILTGFPGETDEDYRQQIDVIQPLIHLQPPIGVGDLWLERFSPYFTRPGDYGVRITAPGEAYPYVYDAAKMDLMKIAYDFEFESSARIDPRLVAELQQTVTEWKQRHESEHLPYLFFTQSPKFVTVYDSRGQGHPVKIRFEGPAARVLSLCNDGAKTPRQMQAYIEEREGQRIAEEELQRIIEELENRRLLYGENGKYLNLALPHNSRW